MTVQAPAFFLADAAVQHDAEGFRRYMHMLTNGGSGVYASTDMAVTQKAAGANMSVDVAGGRAVIAGTQATYQGSYFVENRGVQNVIITAADATNPRRDLIVAKVQDAAYSGAVNAWSLVAVAGTPAASPVDPAVPANAISLARVAVAAGATSITNANLTNLRTRVYRTLPGQVGLLGWVGFTGTSGSVANTPLAIPGMAVAFTTVGGRYVKSTLTITMLQATSASLLRPKIREGSTDLVIGYMPAAASSYYTVTLTAITAPSAGAHTYETYLSTDAGTATVQGATSVVNTLMVEDIGEV